MINRRKQRIISVVVVATLVPAIVAFLIYLFVTGSPDAFPILLGIVGYATGFGLVYLMDYALRTNPSTGNWIRGIVLAIVCVAGFATQAALPSDDMPSRAFLDGLASGAGLVAFLTLLLGVLLPPENSTREGL